MIKIRSRGRGALLGLGPPRVLAQIKGDSLEGRDLGNLQLQGADLEGACLRGSNLSASNLEGACLVRANLQGTILGSTYLRGADLSYADLRGADLRGAVLLKATLDHALYDEQTQWPYRFDPAARGATTRREEGAGISPEESAVSKPERKPAAKRLLWTDSK
jgi:hypothetical protein